MLEISLCLCLVDKKGFKFRIEVNLDAMTHLRIWKPILKKVYIFFGTHKNYNLLSFNPAIQYARSSIDRFISFQPSKSIRRQALVVFSLIYALWKFVFGFGLLVSLLTVDPKKLRDSVEKSSFTTSRYMSRSLAVKSNMSSWVKWVNFDPPLTILHLVVQCWELELSLVTRRE
ncbi:hypothetical protein CMV_022806 [Castanea mollissima]|uniref:Uncharacterized protein n=1 Tax=Castanea mollissima TaxID=60419 RepID=A0A8J4QRJ1_9ROSI|nr:hypothetical protein CMV_022806 [Castanea mollissima]